MQQKPTLEKRVKELEAQNELLRRAISEDRETIRQMAIYPNQIGTVINTLPVTRDAFQKMKQGKFDGH